MSLILQDIFRYINAVDVIKLCFNLAWWNNGPHVLYVLWLYTCTSRSCGLYGLSTSKSILGVSVVVTSGSHLLVKDLAPFKLLFPFSRPILYTKLSCHWWHQMASIIVYSVAWSQRWATVCAAERGGLSHTPPPQDYKFLFQVCFLGFFYAFW